MSRRTIEVIERIEQGVELYDFGWPDTSVAPFSSKADEIMLFQCTERSIKGGNLGERTA